MVNQENCIIGNDEGPDARKSGEEMDQQRQKTLAYEYLCHLEEAKKWMEVCLREQLPPSTELEENLRNGVYLAKLGHYMDPITFPINKIYDYEQRRYKMAGLQFRHTDNINHFLKCLKSIHLPLTFIPETTDVYDKKNMPRLIYCIHALSTHLFKLGKAPQILDLYGKVNFTDEEIDAVSRELKKYGIQMPSFQKIGGLLTHSMPGDAASLHAAVIAINRALSEKDEEIVLATLQNSSAQLSNVIPHYIQEYSQVLIDAKNDKIQAALNRSLDDSYLPDAYDELLTQGEIQGHINHTNVQCELENILQSLSHGSNELITALQAPTLQLQRVIPDNFTVYKEELMKLTECGEWNKKFSNSHQYWQQMLQSAIDVGNEMTKQILKREDIVKRINYLLQIENRIEFDKILVHSNLQLTNLVDEFALPLYYEEMKTDKIESGNDLGYDDIQSSIRVLTAIAAITKAIDTGNPDLVYKALTNPNAHVMDLDEENKGKYCRALAEIRHQKKKKECPILTYIDIQDCIEDVNQQCEQDDQIIQVLRRLNSAITNNNDAEMMTVLKDISMNLQVPLYDQDTRLYMKLFTDCLELNHFDGSELWLQDVQEILQIAALEVEQIQRKCALLGQINFALGQKNMVLTMEYLESWGLNIPGNLKEQYFQTLYELSTQKKLKNICPFVSYTTSKGNQSYLDLEKCQYTWDCPGKVSDTYYITEDDLNKLAQTFIQRSSYSNQLSEQNIIKFQACIKGYLFRKKISERYSYFFDNVDKIIKIQAWWRGLIQRKLYLKFIKNIHANTSRNHQSVHMRGNIKYSNILDAYRQHEGKIIKIQAYWRGYSARKAFNSLLRLDKPPFPIVRHFSTILNFNAEDYDKDLRLQQLKHEVVQYIKHNRNLSQQLDHMDIQIGLLIQNRITLHDVAAHGKQLDFLAKQKHNGEQKTFSIEGLTNVKGLKSLTKEGRKMLEGYQHLFYILQTHPEYLSKLLFLLPQSKTNKFLQNVILTLFNFGSNIREEYLLLKLFGRALQEEIRCKFEKPSEVVTGNPLVLKMVVNYTRQLNGQRALRQIVGPLIEKVLSNKTLSIETNPVDIYKCWRNQLETETGEALDLPHTVTQCEALSYKYVREKLNQGIQLLQNTVLEFLEKITKSRDLIPYGMLYMAKVLNDSLTHKFPKTPEKDILKVVGNLIYYHFINAAIVAPDAFDIITMPIDKILSNDQRRNLASVAKILQFAASKKGFGDEANHLVCLNPFIIDCHEKFKTFFRYCCQVEDLEDHFSIHEYTEATLIHKPEIYISLEEICNTHSLMLEYEDQIAEDPMDPLHDLLEDLGPVPSIMSLSGGSDSISEANAIRFGKHEICLILTNKFEVPDDEDTNLSKLFIKTKELLVSILPFLKGQTLVAALEATCSTVQEKLYDVNKQCSTSNTLEVHASTSLNDCKLQLKAYLNKLELGGWVNEFDGYQNIVTAVAKDLCNKGKYRKLRNKELQTLRITKQRLEEKSQYYQEQVEYYNEYIQRCLDNLDTTKGSLRAFKNGRKIQGKLKSIKTLKYTASELKKKGILLEIKNLPDSQYKNILFEISSTEDKSVFTVCCKFMGIEMEKVDIDIQELLELRFEGTTIIDMFDKAKINVNLLLHLVNLKFYGKIR